MSITSILSRIAAASVMACAPLLHAEVPAMFASMKFVEAKSKATEATKLLLVDATAEWCGPCKKMDKTTWVDEKVVAWVKENAIAIQFDVDKDAELAKHLKIRAMPTIVVFRNGEVLDRGVGYKTPDEFLKWMNEVKAGKIGVTPPEDALGKGPVNIRHHLDYARDLVNRDELNKATTEYAWLWQNILQHDKMYAGVRGSFMAGEMKQLAAQHPPAKQRFTTLRDETEQKLADGKASPNLQARWRGDWIVLNDVVGDDDRTLAWYDANKADFAKTSGNIPGAFRIRSLLEEHGRWADVGQFLGDPMDEVKQIDELRAMAKRSGASEEERNAEVLYTRHRLANVYAAYLAADRPADAGVVAARAFAMDEDPAMRVELVSAAIDVGRPLEKHREWLKQAAEKGATTGEVSKRLDAVLPPAP